MINNNKIDKKSFLAELILITVPVVLLQVGEGIREWLRDNRKENKEEK